MDKKTTENSTAAPLETTVSHSNDFKQTVDYNSKLITSDFKNDYIKELFRSLRAKIIFSLNEQENKSIVITSLEAGAGKSTISSNLSITFAQQGLKTLLIDGDMRCGVLHKLFFCSKNPGLSDQILSINENTDENASLISIQQTTIPNLSLITSGKQVSYPAELLNSFRFKKMKDILSRKFEIIIFDSPPIGVTIDPVIVSELFSKYVIVVKAGSTNIVDLHRKINEFPAIKNKILGFILNQASLDKKLAYYKYSKYYMK